MILEGGDMVDRTQRTTQFQVSWAFSFFLLHFLRYNGKEEGETETLMALLWSECIPSDAGWNLWQMLMLLTGRGLKRCSVHGVQLTCVTKTQKQFSEMKTAFSTNSAGPTGHLQTEKQKEPWPKINPKWITELHVEHQTQTLRKNTGKKYLASMART